MPELPEVETITRRLAHHLVHNSIIDVKIYHPKSVHGDITRIYDHPIINVSRRGKMIRVQFSNGLNFLIHLKMTGQLILIGKQKRIGGGHPTEDWLAQLPSKHTRAEFSLYWQGKREILYFNDQRLFGWIKLMSNEEVEKEFKKLGPDVNSEEFTLQYFQERLRNRSLPIKQFIMDNAVMSGVGNIYACDALNLARISPFRPAKSLTHIESAKLYHSIRTIIQKGIDLGGATTDGKYINVDGLAGKYQLEARVYDRKGQPCLNCGSLIVKAKLGGRGTYYCPECQK